MLEMTSDRSQADERAARQRRRDLIQKFAALGSLVVLVSAFSITSAAFFSVDNLMTVGLQVTSIAYLGVAATCVIITGGIDLSVGSVLALAGVCAALLVKAGVPVPAAMAAGILVGALCGLVNGVCVTQMGLPPFIATLGMMMLLKGLSLVISGTRPIYFNDTPGFTSIAQDSLIGNLIPALPIPNAVLILFLVAIGASIVLNRTIFGRYTFALGSNEEALRLSGVNVDAWKIAVYTFSGAVCGIAGLLIASRLNSAQPALGQGYELDAIAAVVIGGTSLSGGLGRVTGTVIGVLILGVMTSGFTFIRIDAYYQEMVKGAIIVAAVIADQYRNKKKRR